MPRVYNFGAGPAMLPAEVMERVQRELLDYRGLGASVVEISHRSKEFGEIIDRTGELLTELAGIPDDYRILYVHGGAQMQFSAVPLNIIDRRPARKAAYVLSGHWSVKALREAGRYGTAAAAASSEDSGFDRIPDFDPAALDRDCSYLHITSNNTLFGTRWHRFPDAGEIPLVADMTSDFLSRRIDVGRFGVVFAGLQKNLGPAGLALVLAREDLLEHALPETPQLLNYRVCAEQRSLANTTNTFAIYVMSLVLEWLQRQGGVDAIEAANEAKARMLYERIDGSDFYLGAARPEHRSITNVTFRLADESRLDAFLAQAEAAGLYALKGHRAVGGVRASIYNAMPPDGCRALADFMAEFERSRA